MKNITKVIITALVLACSVLFSSRTVSAADADVERHYFTMYTSDYKFECFVEGTEVVAYYSVGNSRDYSKHGYEVQNANSVPRFNFYRLNSSGTGVEFVWARYSKRYVLTDGEWVLDHDYSTDSSPFPTVLFMYSGGHNIYTNCTYDFAGSDIDLLAVDVNDRFVVPQKDGTKKYVSQSHDINVNLYSYLLEGTFTDLGNNYAFTLHESMESIVPIVQFNSSFAVSSNLDISLSVTYDETNGAVSWKDFVVDKSKVKKKGVIAAFYSDVGSGYFLTYRTPLDGTSYLVSLGGTDFNQVDKRYTKMMFIPYYLGTDNLFYIGKGSWIDIAADSTVATRESSKLLTKGKSSTSSGGVLPDKGSDPYPDFSDSQVNNSFSLKNFSASFSTLSKSKYLKVSWNGISHVLTAKESEVNNYKNTFVCVQFAYALKDNVSDIIQKIDYEKVFCFSDNGFLLPWDSIQSANSSAYLKYIKVTPYYNNLDLPTARLYEGKSSFIYFDPYGDLSHTSLSEDQDSTGSGSIREGTRYLSDLYLSGVSVSTTATGNKFINWKGTTSSAVNFVSDSETLVVATYCVYIDSSGGSSVREYKTTTIGANQLYVDIGSILLNCEKEGVLWDNEIRLTPCYRSNGILYIGEQTVVNIYDGSITDIGDSGSGSVSEKPVSSGDSGSSGSSGGFTGFNFSSIGKITDFLNYAISFLFSVVAAMGSFPNLLASVFSFLPSFFIDFLVVSFIVLVFLRVVGR